MPKEAKEEPASKPPARPADTPPTEEKPTEEEARGGCCQTCASFGAVAEIQKMPPGKTNAAIRVRRDSPNGIRRLLFVPQTA